MPLTVTRNFTALADLSLTTRDVMKDVGLLVREKILRRTASGVDASGVPFQPYSIGYAMQKALALGGTGVNLSVSGQMLGSIAVLDATDKSVSVGFTN